MCENKTVIVALLVLAATGYCINQVKSGKKVRHHSEIKKEIPFEKALKSFVCTKANAIIWLTKIL